MRSIAIIIVLLTGINALTLPPWFGHTPAPAAKSLARDSPSLNELLSSLARDKRQTNTSLPNAGVKLCTEKEFAGECYHAEWPVNQCIDLRGYAGITESFLPDDGFECLLMQNKCDASAPYADISDDAKDGGDLTTYGWIAHSTSYICFTEIEALQRFLRVSKLRTKFGSA